MTRLILWQGFDRFDAQDEAIHQLRAFASSKNVHVTVVIHPRKEKDDELLSMTSVFGAAKATQEADTVLILQSVNGAKAIDVKKNRFDGSTGSVSLVFDPATLLFREKGTDPIKGGLRSLGTPSNNKPRLVSEPVKWAEKDILVS